MDDAARFLSRPTTPFEDAVRSRWATAQKHEREAKEATAALKLLEKLDDIERRLETPLRSLEIRLYTCGEAFWTGFSMKDLPDHIVASFTADMSEAVGKLRLFLEKYRDEVAKEAAAPAVTTTTAPTAVSRPVAK